MLNYIDDEIKEKVSKILEFCEKNSINQSLYEIDNPENNDEESIIDNDTGFVITFSDDYESNTYDVETFYEDIIEVEQARLLDGYKYISPRRFLIRMDSLERERIRGLDEGIQNVFMTKIEINGQIIHFNLINGFTNFALLIVVEGDYDERHPPVLYEDLFIEIYSTDQIDESIIDELMNAYIFELSSSMNVEIFPSQRQYQYDYYDLDEDEKNLHLRPLVLGKGIKDVLSIYNSASKIDDPEILILIYTKVIEYVSQTVVRKELLDTILKKLDSPRRRAPDASFVVELERTFEDLGNYKKDKEAIRLTVETCCDLLELVEHSTNYMMKLSSINLDSTKDEKKQAFWELASSITDTRNMIAHAKTNYKPKGNECPKDEIVVFAKCLKIVATQVIRWFLRQHEDSRVV